MIRKVVAILFLSLVIHLTANGQHARLKVGVTTGFEYMGAGGWNKTLKGYDQALMNAAYPGYSEAIKPIHWGYRYGLAADYQLFDGIVIGASYNFSNFKTQSILDETIFNFRTRFRTIALNGDVYLLKFVNNTFIEQIQENFYVRVAPSYSFLKSDMTVPVLGTNPNNRIAAAESSSTAFPSTNAFTMGIGAGYHFYLNDRLSLTATGMADFGFGHSVSGMGDALYQGFIPPNTIKENNGVTTRLSFEVKLSYAIILKKPICPITSCRVQQEHRHAVLGGKVVRGNTYNLRQNQRYGDKHRGEQKPPKRKLTKSEKEQKKIIRKNKRKRKRLVIVGG